MLTIRSILWSATLIMKLREVALFSILLIGSLVANPSTATSYKATILHPLDSFKYSHGHSISGSSQVGVGELSSEQGLISHALLWNGTAESVVDLHPSGFSSSIATGVSGDFQVGYGNH